MGKKRNKGKKPLIKRSGSHNENMTHRYRQYTVNVPLDRDNQPIPLTRKELARRMLDATGSKTTGAEDSMNPPEPQEPQPKSNKVVSLCERRKAASNDDVEYSTPPSAQERISYDRTLFSNWSRDRNRDHIKSWAAKHVPQQESECWELRLLMQHCAAHLNGKNPPPNANSDVDVKPISTVHNPGISAKPVDVSSKHGRPVTWYNQLTPWNPTHRSISLTPSGRLIAEFNAGKSAPPQQPTKSTEVRQSQRLVWAVEEQLHVMFGDVDAKFWPKQLDPYVFDDNGTWRVHTGKVRQAISNQEDRVINRAITLAYIQQKQQDDRLIEALRDEAIHETSKASMLEFELAHRIGDTETVEQMLKEHDWVPQGARTSAKGLPAEVAEYATSYPKPPAIDKLVAEFKHFQSHCVYSSIFEAYGRFHYGDPSLGLKVEEEIERQTTDKLAMVRLRILFKQIPELITLTNDHFRSVKPRPMHNKIQEIRAHRRMVARCRPDKQKAYLSGLVVGHTRHYHRDVKVYVNGQHIIKQHVDMTCNIHVAATSTRPVGKYNPEHGWMHSIRTIHQAVGYKDLATYRQLEHPTLCLLSNDRGTPVEFDCAQRERWEKWLPLCEKRDAERVLNAEYQAEHDRLFAEREHQKAVMRKPLNRAANKLGMAMRKLWAIGQKEVYVSPKVRAEREENERILRERTENEIREANKIAEKERREEAEREALREARRKERADAKAERLAAEAMAEKKAAENKAIKAAARRAYNTAN